MMNVRRVSLIAVVAAFVLSLGPPVSGNAADLPVVRVGKSQAIGVPFMPLMIGDVAGIWEQVGIKLDVSALRGDGQGWDPTAITTVSLGDSKTQQAALATGEIDGVVSGSEFGYDLEEHNQGRMLVTFGPIVPQFLTQVIYARNDFVAQHPELVQKFLLGWYRSVIYMKTHRAQTLALAVKAEGLGENAMARTYDTTIKVMSTDGAFKPEAVERLGKSFVDLGILPQVPDMNKLITRRFVPVKT
jgi:ABC-type nitrate/sulfonate/bicarbonate transport system substrate-binding protein